MWRIPLRRHGSEAPRPASGMPSLRALHSRLSNRHRGLNHRLHRDRLAALAMASWNEPRGLRLPCDIHIPGCPMEAPGSAGGPEPAFCSCLRGMGHRDCVGGVVVGWIGDGAAAKVPTADRRRAEDRLHRTRWVISNVARKSVTTREPPHTLIQLLMWRRQALEPKLAFAKLRSLAYLEEAVLTRWNEHSGPNVERFWQLAKEQGLPFERRDIIREILDRGHIRNDIEFEAATDALMILRDIGKISDEEAQKLKDMIGAFEDRGQRR